MTAHADMAHCAMRATSAYALVFAELLHMPAQNQID